MMGKAQTHTISELFEGGLTLRYKPGEIILRAGDTPSGVYLITSGVVKISSANDKDEEVVRVIIGYGEIFPLLWAMHKPMRPVNFIALEEVELIRVDRKNFLDKAYSDAGIAMALATQIAEQYAIYADRIDNLQYTSARDRLIYRLIILSQRFGTEADGAIVIDAAITQTTLAKSINIARETVGREMEYLMRNHLVYRKRGKIVIMDIEKLHAELKDKSGLTFLAGYKDL